jgi:hypothetical protein
MTKPGDKVPAADDRPVLSRDSWISEKRGLSPARDLKTGLLLSGGDRGLAHAFDAYCAQSSPGRTLVE